MNDRSVSVMGLPGAGKTTYLAALWHAISPASPTLSLTLDRLEPGVNLKYLKEISERWRSAMAQERTALVGMKQVTMCLKDADGRALRLTFPDVHGEAFSDMWETRHCEENVAETLRSKDLVFFIHADRIAKPRRIVDRELHTGTNAAVNDDNADERTVVPWHANQSPTQVQVVDFLQLLSLFPLDVGPRKMVIFLSAWDKVEADSLSPDAFLAQRLPLVYQYLAVNIDRWKSRVFGISAQGGEYETNKSSEQELGKC